MPSWPATLPQKQFLGLTTQDQDSVIRTPMESGPPSRRSRFTAIAQDVNVPLILTGAQKQTFDTFFRTTLIHGSIAFDWEDPTLDTTVSFAFRQPPTWTMGRGGSTNVRVWNALLALEIQP